MANVVSADNITELYRIGAVRLPRGAVEYGAAANEISTTADHEGAGFEGALGTSPVLPAFQGLRNIVQDEIIGRTRNNIVASGNALCSIAESFSETDSSNGADLAALKEKLETGKDADGEEVNPNDLPPEHIPEAPPSSGEEAEAAEEYEEIPDAPDDIGGYNSNARGG